jgi:predicted kinase
VSSWSALAELLPAELRPAEQLGPPAAVDLEPFAALLPELIALRGCAQDPIFHAEGDVWVHTERVLGELCGLSAWAARPSLERQALALAALLHDVAKPRCTQAVEGRVRSPGHARRGALMTRALLYRLGTPFDLRELTCALIAEHALPLVLLRKARGDAERRLFAASQRAPGPLLALLALLAEADVRGRECGDQAELLDEVALFVEYAREQRCLDGPRAFANDHSRFEYFRAPGRDPHYAAHEEPRGELVVLSGLPGAGKDHHCARRFADWPVVSLDAVRAELGAAPTGQQGAVIDRARELARRHLRAGQSFVWNATCLTRDLRRRVIDLAASYRFRCRILYIEVPWTRLCAQNAQRSGAAALPRAKLARLLERWELPDLTEAHLIERELDDQGG